MKWEEQGEQDAEAVQKSLDFLSHLQMKCIILTSTKMHKQAGVKQQSASLSASVPPSSREWLSRRCCKLLHAAAVLVSHLCSSVRVLVRACVCVYVQSQSALQCRSRVGRRGERGRQ